MKNRLSFRILSLLFALVFLVTALPLGIFANDTEPASNVEAEPSIECVSTADVSLLPTGYEPEPSFVSEVTELRTENVKHFDNGDGTFEAVSYGTAVHRKDVNGEWQDIDNTLTLREDRGEERYVSSDARISFAPVTSGSKTIWSLSENGYSVSLSVSDSNLRSGSSADVRNHATRAEQISAAKKADDRDAVLRVDNSTSIVYRNVLPGVDLEYVLSGNDVKETILVQNVRENYDFAFKLSLSGLIPKATDDGAILLCDAENGESVYVIPAPYMTDANYEYSDAVSYRLTKLGDGEYEIKVAASAEWINDPERAFPVAIDPTVTCFTNTSNTYDTYVDSMTDETKATSYGSSVQMIVHPNRTSFIKTTATSMPSLPSGAFVLDAKLNIVYRYTNLSGANNIEIGVYRYSQNWDENSTWNSLSNYGTDPDLGITGTPITTFAPINDSEWHSISLSITSAAAYWYSGSQSPTNGYYGLALKKYSGKYATYIRTSNASQTDERPSFSVSYSLVNGVYAIRKANTDYCIRSEKTIASTISIDNLPSFTGTSASEKDHLFKIIYRSAHNDYIFRSMENNELILYPDMSGSIPTVKWGKITVSGAPATDANLPTDYTWRMSTSPNGYDLIFHRENYAAPNYYLQSVSNGNGQSLTLTTTSTASGTEWEFPKYTGSSLYGVFSMQSVSVMITGETIDFDFYLYDDRIGVNGPVSYAIYDTNWNPSTLATVNSTTGVCTVGTTAGTFRLGVTYPSAPWIWGYNITIEASREGTYFIQNREQNYYIQIDNNDAPNYSNNGGIMEIWPFDGANYQRWTLDHVGNGYYKITSPISGYAITVPTGYESSDNVSLILTTYTGTDNQKWRITTTTGSAVKIKAKSSEPFSDDLVMDLETLGWFQSASGLDVRQREYVQNSSYNDEWYIEKLDYSVSDSSLIYVEFRVPTTTIALNCSTVSANWTNLFVVSANAWNSAIGSNISFSNTSLIECTVDLYPNENWRGKTTPLTGYYNDGEILLVSAKIEINTIKCTGETEEKRSTITHEIGHLFGLNDNPPVGDAYSLMRHNRDRSAIYVPTPYDIANVLHRYGLE